MRLRIILILGLMLAAAIPATADIVGNTLSLSDGSAPAGSLAAVSLDVANEDAIGGIQTDILFDVSVAAFSGISISGRGTGMTVEGRVVEPGRLRVVLYYSGSGSLSSGTGPVAELSFLIQGDTDDVSALTMSGTVLSDSAGENLSVISTAGSLTTLAPDNPPVMHIAALKNPGQTRTVIITVSVIGGSGDAPAVAASGVSVGMTSLGDGVYKGQYHASAGLSTLTITATDSNSHGTGNAQVILALP